MPAAGLMLALALILFAAALNLLVLLCLVRRVLHCTISRKEEQNLPKPLRLLAFPR